LTAGGRICSISAGPLEEAPGQPAAHGPTRDEAEALAHPSRRRLAGALDEPYS
jgi:hypothetical protein